MKISYWSPYVGHVGTIKAVINSALAMHRFGGHEVAVIRNHTEWEGYESEIQQGGVTIVDFGLKRWLPGLERVRFGGSRLYMFVVAIFGFFQLRRYLNQQRPDVLVANLIVLPAILSARWLRPTPKIVVSIQGFPKFLGTGRKDYPAWMKVEDAIRKRLWNRVYRHADLIVCMTEPTREKLLRNTCLPADRVTVIKNPVIDDGIFALARQPLTDSWFVEGSHKRVVAIGRLTAQKDFGSLIRAAAKVAERVDLRLVILGEGEERTALQTEIDRLGAGEFIALRGFVANPYAYLGRADLFVMSSLWEDPGHAILEAAALRVPIVSTDCPSGPADLLEHGRGGWLCPTGEVECLGEKMADALTAGKVESMLDVAQGNAMAFSSEAHEKAYRTLWSSWCGGDAR